MTRTWRGCASRAVPLIVEYAFEDLNALELSPWEPKGGSGAIINIPNRLLPNDAHVVEIAPGGKAEPVHHMYETQMYVLSGRARRASGWTRTASQTFEWKAGSVFAIPLNAWYQLFNGSGAEPARYIAVTSAPPIMRLYRDNHFIFNLPYVFSDRYADDSFNGSGSSTTGAYGVQLHPQRRQHALYGMPLRGAGGINAQLEMAKNSITAHISRVPGRHLQEGAPPRPRRAPHHPQRRRGLLAPLERGRPLRHAQGGLEEGLHGRRPQRADVPPALQHRHQAARYLALRQGEHGLVPPYGGSRPGADVSMKAGGRQIEYEDEARGIHDLFEAELARTGATCHMKNFIPYCTGDASVTNERET